MEDCMGNEVAAFLEELRVKPLEDFHCLKTFCSGFIKTHYECFVPYMLMLIWRTMNNPQGCFITRYTE